MSPERTSNFPPLDRLWKSTAILGLILVAGGIVASYNVPSDWLDAADGVPSKYKVLVSKLTKYFRDDENPEVVILGSSLVLMPAVRCDDRLEGKQDCHDEWYYYKHIPEYDRSVYLEQALNKRSGLDLRVRNLGVASSIMSDHAGVLQAIFAQGKSPRLVICGIAPRDFLDNSQQKFMETPSQMFLRELELKPNLLPRGVSEEELGRWWMASNHQFRKIAARLKGICSDYVCQLTGHPSHLQFTRTSDLPLEGKPNLLKDLDTYRKLYNPPNFGMLAEETAYLRKLISFANERGAKVVLVNMPLTRQNIAALDPQAHRAYLETIRSVSREEGAVLVDIGSASPDFSLSDFEDCCHLNAAGGWKLYDKLLSAILGDRAVLAHLSDRLRRKAVASGSCSSPR